MLSSLAAKRKRPARRRHAAGRSRLLMTVAIAACPSIFRSLICPLATRLKSRIRAASSVGREPCVFTRRRNSSLSRSITFVVRSVFHCAFGKAKKVSSSAPPSCRLRPTPGQRFAHLRSKAVYAARPVSADAA